MEGIPGYGPKEQFMRAIPDSNRLWTIKDLADFLRVPVDTIYKWRSAAEGPRGLRVGRNVRFREADVLAWLETRRDDI
jgi:excisionase family DNA binding protein